MGWGIGWGILVIFVLVLLVAYAIIQETRAQLHWRGLVQQGDVDAVRMLVEQAMAEWRSERPPPDVPGSIWQAISSADLVDVRADFVRVSAAAEGRFATAEGRRREVSSALDEAMTLTVRLADRFLYDIPNLQLDAVQVDVYTTFREERGPASQQCILTTLVQREDAAEIDWDGAPAEEIVQRFGGHYELDDYGAPRPVEPLGGPPDEGGPGRNGAEAAF